jgi:polar amino acid transport system substrate-binding protein
VLVIRRSLLLLGCLLVLLVLAGCQTLGLGQSASGRIVKSGQLRVGMAGDYPPMNVRTRDGRLIGLEADLARALASILEVELVLVEKPFGELLAAVEKGEVDVAISGITMTPRRNLKVAFAGPYYIARKAILGRQKTLDGLREVQDLKGRGLRVAALAGSTSENLVRQMLPDSKYFFESNQNEALQRVLKGQADVLIADDPVVRFAMLRHRYSNLAFVESAFSAEPLGIAIGRGDPVFVNLVENFLENLELIGLMNTLRVNWFENADWIEYLP